MPSSPEPAGVLDRASGDGLPTAAVLWEPEDIALLPELPARPAVTRPAVFEVGSGSVIPPEVLEPARRAAEAAGYAAGWAAGVRAADRRVQDEAEAARQQAQHIARADRERCARALAALAGAAADLDRRSAPALAEIEQVVLSAAYDIAEALVGVALRDDATRGRAALARVLALTEPEASVTVHLSPADLATLTDGSVPPQPGVELVADPGLQPGDARAASGATTVDARLAAGLARVRQVLRAEDGTP